MVLFLLGVANLFVAFAIGRTWTMLWRKEDMGFPATLQPQDRLITHGIFRYVRHPHNLMIILGSLGLSFISLGLHYLGLLFPWTLLSFLLLFAVFPLIVCLVTLKEEGRLIERFGEQYLEYKRRVPMLIPRKQFWGICLRIIRGDHRRPPDD